jgi:aldehyde dehydrogenase (NAD+)
LANNTRYGLAASIWSQNIDTALDVAKQIKAGVVWINSTNVFDAASGFGGYRESGFGREGGREGMYEYLKAVPSGTLATTAPSFALGELRASHLTGIDRTPKMYIGGKQVRPDSGYSRVITSSSGAHLGEVGEGNRKDIRNAVEAARAAASGWANTTAHNRAQILYYIGENLYARANEFAQLLASQRGVSVLHAAQQVEATIQAWFTAAAWADKYDGAVHHTPQRAVVMALPEPIGVMGLVAPDAPSLLGSVALMAPAIAMGNSVVVIPSESAPLGLLELYQVFDTSDVPAGVINIVSGQRSALVKTLAEHGDVDGLWAVGDSALRQQIQQASTSNLKRTWVLDGSDERWLTLPYGEFLRQAVQWKNVWVPYGA